ncbi:MAG TPA: DUF4159 domain-containing protein [Longimicrobiales bacterium]|nr:DUF4159 domain-containing protein [Longimicrobiales bacterium]
MSRRARWRATLGLGLLATAGTVAVLDAQQGRRGDRSADCYVPEQCPRAPYDGRVTFARVYFPAGGGSGMMGGFGEPPWHHDRPWAERNLSSIIREISYMRTFDGWHGGNVFALDDPEIFRHPVLWLAEPGYWVPTDEQVLALRAYLEKGGFIIFDDFFDQHWVNFSRQMARVLPELRPIRLTGSEPVFRSFFDIDIHALNIVYRGYTPEFYGIFEDNDPTKRQLAMINYNGDIGEFMEYSATGFAPVDVTNEAYRLAVNYFFYTMVH